MPLSPPQAAGRAVSALVLASTSIGCRPAPEGPLIFAAAALGPPIRALDSVLGSEGAEARYRLETSPSLEAVRKLTDLGKVPDILAVADLSLLDSLVVPAHASWYLVFGTNALVLAYGPRSQHADKLGTVPWHEVLRLPGVRTGRSDPLVDPSGYRTLMALDLAERHYRLPGLASRLLEAMPRRYMRHAEADLSAMVQSGELDYVWTYRNLAKAHGLQWVELPPEVNLEDPALASWYAGVELEIGAAAGRPGLRLQGRPILFGLTIPASAARPDLGRHFIDALTSSRGRAVLERNGFHLLAEPYVVGVPPRE